jgi:Skp family chaperone for outer membrane proteins
MNIDKLGWLVAAGLVGAMFGMGFQTAAPKFAVVDLQKVFSDSDFTANGNVELQAFAAPRRELLQFLQQNLSMAPDDAKRLAELSRKATRTSAEDAEIAKIKTDAAIATQKRNDLLTKPSPTPDEQKQLTDYSARLNQNQDFGAQLEQQMGQELDNEKQVLRDKAMDQVRKSVGDVAKKDGYSVVFTSDTAPYAANDITPDALKAVKK